MADLDRQHKKYIESGRWKCPDSPTNAHHWVEHSGDGIFICKWCMDVRKFPRTFDGILKVTYGKKVPFTSLRGLDPLDKFQQPVPLKKRSGKKWKT